MIQFNKEKEVKDPDGWQWKREYQGTRLEKVCFVKYWDNHPAKSNVTIKKLSNGSLDFYKSISAPTNLGKAISHLVEVEKIKRSL